MLKGGASLASEGLKAARGGLYFGTPGMPGRLGVKVPRGGDGTNHKPRATAPSRGGVGRKPGGETAIRGTRTAYEAGRSGRAGRTRQSPSPSRDRNVNAAGARRRWPGLSGEASTRFQDARPRLKARSSGGRDSAGRKVGAHRGGVSRGHSTGGPAPGRAERKASEDKEALTRKEGWLRAANSTGSLAGSAGG